MLNEEEKPQNRIAKLRKERGLSQAQLAKETGLTRQAISLYEIGKREPKLEIWIKLADFFNVPVSYLQGISNNKKSNLVSDSKKVVALLDELDKDGANSPKSKNALKRLEEMEANQGLNDFSLLYSAMKKTSEGVWGADESVKSLTKKQLTDIYEKVSRFYYLAIEAKNGDKLSEKYYKKMNQLYSEYLEEFREEDLKNGTHPTSEEIDEYINKNMKNNNTSK